MDVLNILMQFIATIAVLVGGLWALTKYVLERGLVPAANLAVECEVIGGRRKMGVRTQFFLILKKDILGQIKNRKSIVCVNPDVTRVIIRRISYTLGGENHCATLKRGVFV